ncbi:hypothetical protein HME9302_00743 [Alteripontixanthobacter maritimus]|uniref:CAAX prenyl protease 2/Lysostaphin resistance protein A-like domain-containing protein n=1 Tax=Alteripontixanthobacter maritimus TaxID=2161824 RepID=A0A369Q3U0_9SPHN|nr:CPBP family intramembrane glutamic endopeptidase [Alteripontixanthobacter maritimus]RDC59553.1 hypothetical protein HME9302_00743 [Alteripontixanthobacter maritimus]
MNSGDSKISVRSGETRPLAQNTPIWRQIIDFPLSALVIGLVAIAAVIAGFAFLRTVIEPPESQLAAEAIATFTVVFAVFAVCKLVINRIGVTKRDDLPLATAVRDLTVGIVGAAILMSVIVGVAALFGVYRIDGWGTASDAGFILLVAGVFAGFVEEVIFRGVMFRFLEEFAGSWAALAVTSLLFGAVHYGNDNATVLSSFAIAIEAGVMLGGAYMLTRSLWLAVGIHFSWNVTQGLVWDVPVSGNQVDGIVDARAQGPELLSGGAFGLEASVIAMVLATAAGLFLVRMAVRRGHVMQPWWTRRRLEQEKLA